ncbi:EboA domain-containing protein [Shewanella surugensis]|uniref:EboA domain-containing protein n=1 Tax=Shewanella surugensis TaxID=212020 RepID=A0ABT0LFD0_9GAMM|nr:EboA domain-containing protein [Shewanella surugensis]MCL1126416.1 EboA domain-containing protein [Shewanella surugensis]
MISSNTKAIKQLTQLLTETLSQEQIDWFYNVIGNIQATLPNNTPKQLAKLWSEASIKTARYLEDKVITYKTMYWNSDQLARFLLFTHTLSCCHELQRKELCELCFHFADDIEAISIVKGLHIADTEGKLTQQIIHISQTNYPPLFSAIALNNPWPAAHYSTEEFNQLVLKALFLDLDTSKIVNIKQRHNHALSILATDLIRDRLATKRQPPQSILSVIEPQHLNINDKTLINRFCLEGIPA